MDRGWRQRGRSRRSASVSAASSRARTTRSPTSPACASGTRRSSRATGPLVVGQGPVRTGVTVILPARGRRLGRAGVRRLPPAQRQRRAHRARVDPRGGPARRAGRDHQHPQRRRRPRRARRPRDRAIAARAAACGRCPVVGETWDGLLNDIDGLHVRPEHVDAALAAAADGAGRRGQRRRRHRHGLPRVQGRDRDGVARAWAPTRAAGPSACSSRRTTASASSCGSTACRSASAIPVDRRPEPVRRGGRGRRRRGRRTPGGGLDHHRRRDRRPAPAPPVRPARAAGDAGPGADGQHREPLVGRPLPRFATGNRGLATTDEPGVAAPVTARGADGPRQPDDAAVQGHRRGDRGGGRQRPARRGDADGPRRRHRPRARPRPPPGRLARYGRGPRAAGGA